MLKIVDKEHKKIQLKARKERNEEVRSLVAFVKKRDKRVQAYKKVLEERAELNRQKSNQKQIEQLQKLNDEVEEQRKNMGSVLNEGYEEQLKQLEADYFDLYLNDEDEDNSDEEESYEDLSCVACNRVFKDSHSYTTHLSTKKHRLNEMLLTVQNTAPEDDEDLQEEMSEQNLDEVKPTNDDEVPKKSKKKGGKKAKAKQSVIENESSGTEIVNGKSDKEEEDDDFDWNKKKGKKVKQKASNKPAKNNAETQKSEKESPVTQSSSTTSAAKDCDKPPVTTHLCSTCKSQFPSKNKLFDHLKKTNHSVYIPKK